MGGKSTLEISRDGRTARIHLSVEYDLRPGERKIIIGLKPNLGKVAELLDVPKEDIRAEVIAGAIALAAKETNVPKDRLTTKDGGEILWFIAVTW